MIMRVFYDGDTYVSLPGGFKTLDYLVSSSWRSGVDGAWLTKIVLDYCGLYRKAFRAGETGHDQAVGGVGAYSS